MKQLSLSAKKREQIGKQVKDLRQQGLIPAVIYGHKVKSQPLVVDYLDFEKIYHQAGESSLVDLSINKEKPVKVLIQDIQIDPVTDRYLHIDFYQIKMGEKIHAKIPFKFVGQSRAVRELGGILETSLKEVEVECLPNDLVHEIKVDLSVLNAFDDVIYIKDLQIPPGIKVLLDKDSAVAVVNQPRTEKEEKPIEGEADKADKEGEKTEKEGEAKAEAGDEGKVRGGEKTKKDADKTKS